MTSTVVPTGMSYARVPMRLLFLLLPVTASSACVLGTEKDGQVTGTQESLASAPPTSVPGGGIVQPVVPPGSIAIPRRDGPEFCIPACTTSQVCVQVRNNWQCVCAVVCPAGTIVDDLNCKCLSNDCGDARANCGTITVTHGADRHQVDCGECSRPYDTCEGGGVPNQCGCTPLTCADLPGLCGTMNDGCGGTLDCTCTLPETCEGGGVQNECGCTPLTCADLPGFCGTVDDGCGGTLDCTCTLPETCGGGGVQNECGCTPTTCADLPGFCGTVDDGCGGTLDCACTPPETCGGGGVQNQCGEGALVHFDCGGDFAMDVGRSITCSLPASHEVVAVYTSVGCNDGETATFTLSFDDGSSLDYEAGCGSSFGVGQHLTRNMVLTMNSGGGPDNHISFTCCGSGGWQVDYR